MADEALAEVDHILVDLVGAFDATARVAHRALDIEGRAFEAGWQRGRWLKLVAASAPGLAALIEPGSMASDLFEVMRLMRNTVHGAGLQAMGLMRGTGVREATAVSLPMSDTARLVELLEDRGWSGDWGLSELHEGRFHVSPEAFVEHILETSMPIINALMRETPVEQLTDTRTQSFELSVPDNSGPYALRNQRCVLIQLGLTSPVLAR